MRFEQTTKEPEHRVMWNNGPPADSPRHETALRRCRTILAVL